MSYRRNKLAYAVAHGAGRYGIRGRVPGIAVAQEAGAEGIEEIIGDRAAPHAVAAGRADRDAGRGQRR